MAAAFLESRIANVMTWVARLRRLCPIGALSQELVKFDTQLMQNPEISGVEYQQGTLAGYELREYLLEKWGRRCAYCKTDVPLQIEHLTPRARGGSNRASNLTLACEPCNVRKGTQTAAEFGFPDLQAQAKQPLNDAAAVNATRWALYERLKATGLARRDGDRGQNQMEPHPAEPAQDPLVGCGLRRGEYPGGAAGRRGALRSRSRRPGGSVARCV